MSVLTLGLNHQSAPLDLRGRFAIPVEQLGGRLQSLHESLRRASPEAAIVSTCNRTELYVAGAGTSARELAGAGAEWLAQLGRVSVQSLEPHLYQHEDEGSARHAFRVASGLDSMVLGEPQILGQMKLAARQAGETGTLGTALHQLFQRSFAVAKAVRSRTDIGSHSVSLSAAAVRLAERLFEDLSRTAVLFVGAGEMIEGVATHCASRRPGRMVVANRSLERAQRWVGRVGASCMPLGDMPRRLHEFDVVVSCTASAVPLIGLGAVERALKARRQRPMLLVDLAVPRDIEPEVDRLSDAYLYTLDDLHAIVHDGAASRQAAVAHAEQIIDAGVRDYADWLTERQRVPRILELQHRAEGWQAAELRRARRRLARGEPLEAVLQALSRGLTAKLLHGQYAQARAEASGPAGDAMGGLEPRDLPSS